MTRRMTGATWGIGVVVTCLAGAFPDDTRPSRTVVARRIDRVTMNGRMHVAVLRRRPLPHAQHLREARGAQQARRAQGILPEPGEPPPKRSSSSWS